jgi:dTDP-4-dehydrorhamnose reductase
MKPGILITGGSGLLAVNWAAAVGHRYAVTLGLHERRIVVQGAECRVISLDSTEAIIATIRQARAVVVVHSAAMTSVDACEAAPEVARHANVEIARNVAEACNSLGTKLVHISTDHVFDGTRAMLDERSAISPINVYARTKARGEEAVLDACPSTIVVRTNFFGWGLPYRKSFSDTIIHSLRTGQEIGLFTDAYFTPILMGSLIDAANDLVDACASGIFHVVGDERISKYDFGLKIARTFGLNARLIKPTFLAERSDLTPRPSDLSLDNRKLRAAVGHDIGDVHTQLAFLLARESNKPQLDVVVD